MLEAALSTFPPDIQEQATKPVDIAATPESPEVAEPLKTVDPAPPLKNENAQNKAAEPQSEEENTSGPPSAAEATPKPALALLSTSASISVKATTDMRILTITQTVTVSASTADARLAL